MSLAHVLPALMSVRRRRSGDPPVAVNPAWTDWETLQTISTEQAGGHRDWENPANISGTANFTRTEGGLTVWNPSSWRILGTNPGLTIPESTTIVAVEARYERQTAAAGTTHYLSAIQLVKAGAVTGTPKGGSGDTFGGDWQLGVYGGADDLWGATLTRDDVIASGFGVAIQHTRTGDGPDQRSHARGLEMRVLYQESL